MENEKYLPIGSVVLLKGGTKKIMITGFCVKPNKNEDKIYDYMGCLYPEGIIDLEKIALFNRDQITKIIAFGYSDEDDILFKNKLVNYLESKK